MKPIEARGGIGNCVNAAWASQVSGRPLRWRPRGELRPDDLFSNPEVLELTEEEGGQYVWLFPNIDPPRLGTPGHYPQHEGVPEWHWHWLASEIVTGELPVRLQLRKPARLLPPGTIGVHVRTQHPMIRCDIARVTARVNALSENATVYLASDGELPGISSAVLRSAMRRPEHDDDRSRPTIESALHDWFTLGRCAEIHRIHASSSFADCWCFVRGIPMKRLLAPEALESTHA